MLKESFEGYKVLDEVGVGGLGKVYRAIDLKTGQTVAIKVLHEKYAMSRKFLGIFHRELLIVSSLHHKHIVSYLNSYFKPPVCYIVSEFIDGWPLHKFVRAVGRVPPLVALSIIFDMLQGIDYLHLHDTIHSDLSAPNVLIDKSGRVLVTDFGLACQIDIEDYKNYMVGTPGYYSPEHITDTPMTPATDIYCTGLMLFEMMTGKKAVPALTDRRQIYSAMKNIPFSLIVTKDGKMQSMFRKLLKRVLHIKAHKRIQSADEMMLECFKILKHFELRFARHAIQQFLIDQNLAKGPLKVPPQNIYYGM